MNNSAQRARDAGQSVVNWDIELDEKFSKQLPSVSVNDAARQYAGDKGMSAALLVFKPQQLS